MADSLIMTSGGIESAVMVAQAVRSGEKTHALFFDIGTPSADAEYHAASRVTRSLGVNVERLDMTSLRPMLLKFMSPAEIASEGDVVCPDVAYVPLYAATAAYYGESIGTSDVRIGLTKEQVRSGTEFFLSNIGKTIASYQEDVSATSLTAPFIRMSKSDVVKLGVELKVNLSVTWSCSMSSLIQCGSCQSCSDRRDAFRDADIEDLTVYQS